MATRKRPHSTNGLNHEMEGITIRNGESNSNSGLDSIKYTASNRPVRTLN